MLFAIPFRFEDVIRDLQSIGVYEYLLPFLLIFAIIFAVLEKTQILGEHKSNINVVVSLIFGLLIVAQQGIIETINNFLPNVSLIIVVILALLLVVGLMVGKKFEGIKGPILGLGIIVVIIAFVIALWPNEINFMSSYDKETLLYTALIIAAVIAVVWLIVGGKRDTGDSGVQKFFKAMEGLGKGFGGS